MSIQVVRIEGFSKGSLKNIGNEVDRENVDHRNQDIDNSLSHLNYSYKDAPNGMYNEWSNVLTSLNADVRIRKDSVAFEGAIITSDKEFFQNLGWVKGEKPPEAVQNFFDSAYDFAKKQFGFLGTDKNFLSAKVHYDETTPHLQLYYVPVTEKWNEKIYQRDKDGHIIKNEKGVSQQAKGPDGKALFNKVKDTQHPRLNRSEFWRARGGQSSYRKMQNLFHETVGKDYGLERGEVGSDREHQTKAQWENKQLQAEKQQLSAQVDTFRKMKTAIDQVDIQGKKNVFGGIVVKPKEFETLIKHAKAYAANRDNIENFESRQKAIEKREHDLYLREAKVNYLEHCARNLHDQQKDLNNNYSNLQHKVEMLTSEKAKLKGDYEKQSTDYANMREAYCRAVQAAGMLLWDDETGYKVDLPQKAKNLITAINKRAEMDFIELGDREHVKDVQEFIGIDKRIERLMSKQMEPVQHEIRNEKQEKLIFAVLEDSPDKISQAIESGADIMAFYKDETVLHVAVLEHKYKAAKKLLENGEFADALDKKMKTPLYYAVSENDTKMAELLLNHGASSFIRVNGKTINDMTMSTEMNELLNQEKEIQRSNHLFPPSFSR